MSTRLTRSAVIVVVTGCALAIASLAHSACAGGDSDPVEGTTRTSTAATSPTFDDTTPTPLPPTRKLVFDAEPRPVIEATPAALIGEPCEFRAWDGKTALIHDLEACETTRLGNGFNAVFNEASTHAAWIERTDIERPGPVWVIDLRSGDRTLLVGAGADSIAFSALGNLQLTHRGSPAIATFNVQGTPVDEPQTPSPTLTVGPRSDEVSAPDGYRLFRSDRYVLTDRAGDPLWEFEARAAYAIGDDLLVATTSTNSTPMAPYEGTQNLYLLDPATGHSEFLATVSADHRAAGNDRFVFWSEGFCTDTGTGTTHIFDIATGAVRKLNFALQGPIHEDGMFVGFMRRGATFDLEFDRIVFDVETLEARAIIRGYGSWNKSDDGRYFAERLFRGGGLCI